MVSELEVSRVSKQFVLCDRPQQKLQVWVSCLICQGGFEQ